MLSFTALFSPSITAGWGLPGEPPAEGSRAAGDKLPLPSWPPFPRATLSSLQQHCSHCTAFPWGKRKLQEPDFISTERNRNFYTWQEGSTESVCHGLQYITDVTATINCSSNGLVPSLCAVFLQVKHTCASNAAPAAQPSLCFWMRRNTESRAVPPFISHLHIRNIGTLYLPLFLVLLFVWSVERRS